MLADGSDTVSFVKEILVSLINILIKGLKLYFLSLIDTYNKYNPIDFFIFFYLGYLGGLLILKPLGLIESNRLKTGYIVAGFFYYIVFGVCISLKTPFIFGFFTALTLLLILNIFQVKTLTYKDLALIFPIFAKFKHSKPPEPTISYDSEEKIKNYLDTVFTEAEKATQKRIRKEKEKERIQRKIDKKIDEVIKKLENF